MGGGNALVHSNTAIWAEQVLSNAADKMHVIARFGSLDAILYLYAEPYGPEQACLGRCCCGEKKLLDFQRPRKQRQRLFDASLLT